ncbi:MAG TPA: prephenate dehydrogenase/arogenate dehydrogenase family protein, partial [Gaiellaceae bacterium]|nr:prephenate dehydrogenase/arogenate dehydrogenase family protein [Gaiellaceae bacterium]
MTEPTPELRDLRREIDEIDRALLDALNRRLELVRRVREHKQEAGARVVDAEREAELLKELTALNRGPLSDRAVSSLFAAVLDVMKQEAAEAPQRRPAAPAAPASLGLERLAVVGTGLVGTSVALAARRAGAKRIAGHDASAATLREASARGAFDVQGSSLTEALEGAELVVVAVPVGAVVETTRAALAAAGPDATVTDVASTKRSLVASIDDPRYVPGHPVAGGETGGPARAAPDLFDGATWFLTPTATTDAARLAAVERFVTALGARPVRQDAEEHDRLLALTSHLPHALANLLMGRVAAASVADEAPLEHAGASLRDMTRIAGANPAVWIDIFVENGDLIADALEAYGADLDDVERALRDRDRGF